jgi:hypothetical protein
MRPALGLLAICLPLAALADTKAPPAPKPDPGALSEQAVMLAPIQVDSLTLTPVVATQTALANKQPDLIVLDEGMASKAVRITEFDEGDVNNLTFKNTSDKPVFLLAGEVVLGGKQDRIIGKNTVIPAKTTQQVPVYCVEHGRWATQTSEFTTANALAHGRLRAQASYAGQQDVWNEVASKNAVRKTSNATDTYRTVAKQQSDGTLATTQKKVEAALAKVAPADRARMVGYVVSLNGKVATVDMFSSPKLFAKLETKLVRSYITEAIDIEAAKNIKAPTAADVKTFMADADKAAEQKSYETKAARTKVNSGARAAKSAVYSFDGEALTGELANPSAAPAPAVYQNYQAK